MKRKAILLFVVFLLIFGCSSSNLTRRKAKDIIEESDNYKPQKRAVPLARSEVDVCVKQGHLKWKGFMFTWNLLVTEEGKKFFDGAGGEIVGNVYTQQFYVVPSTPIKPHVIEVTGITDGDNGSKIVEYQWNWDCKRQPQEVQDLVFKSNPANLGKATLKLYDDGWRVVKFE